MPKKVEIFVIETSELDFYLISLVRELRIEKKISQKELSVRMDWSEGAVSKIENPRLAQRYNIRHINLLAKALNVSPRALMPEQAMRDIIRVTYRVNPKHRTNKIRTPDDKQKPYFEVIKIMEVKVVKERK